MDNHIVEFDTNTRVTQAPTERIEQKPEGQGQRTGVYSRVAGE